MQLEYLEYTTRYVNSIDADAASKDVLARWTDVMEKLESDPMELDREARLGSSSASGSRAT